MVKSNRMFGRVLSVILCLTMCFTSFVLFAPVKASAAAAYGCQDTTYRVNTDQYGTPYWTGTALNTHWMQWTSGSDYVKVTYPHYIYLDISETLQSAGYKINVDWQFGSSTAYRIALNALIWGGDFLDSALSSSTIPYRYRTMTDMFDGYTVDADSHGSNINGGVGSNSTATTGVYKLLTTEYWDNAKNVVWLNPGNSGQLTNTIYLIGTPKTTGTGQYNTSENSPIRFGEANKDNNKNGSPGATNLSNAFKSKGDSSYKEGSWAEICINVTIYDKSALNTEIGFATSQIDPNAAYTDLLVGGDWNAYVSAKNSAQSTLTLREQGQDSIDAAKTALYDKASALVFQANDDALVSAIAAADAIVAESDYITAYTADSRAAMQAALTNAKSRPASYLNTYNAYLVSGAGAAAASNQAEIDSLTSALNLAINGMNLNAPDYSAYTEFKAEHPSLTYGVCYTADTLTAYNDAIAAMEALIADTSLSKRNDQPTVDAAMAAINTAYANLEVEHRYALSDSREANCVETGYQTYSCRNENCTEAYTVTYPIVASNHKGPIEVVNQAEGNCGTNGYTGDSYCSACNKPISSGTVIPATGEHDYQFVAHGDATCITKGFDKYTCSVCGGTKTIESDIDPNRHIGLTTILNKQTATCTETGYTGDTWCNDCNTMIEEGTSIPAKGHTPGSTWVTLTEPGCGSEGEKVKYCTVCGEVAERESIAATGNHTEEILAAKPASCRETGLTAGVRCSVCGTILVEQEIIPVLPHTIPDAWDEIVEPYCGTDGYKVKYCTECGEEVERETIPTTGAHTMEYAEGSRIASTCITQGSETYQCKTCDYQEVRTLATDPNNHESTEIVVKNAVDATCGTDGYSGDSYHKCCDALIATGSVLPRNDNHSWTVDHTDAATCCSEGTAYYKCSVCGDTKTETLSIDPSAHGGNVETRNVSPSSCTASGYTGDEYCLDCGNPIREGTVIPAKGHTPGVKITTKEATCSESGMYDVYCADCGICYTTEVIPAAPHDIVTIPGYEATCTLPGLSDGQYCLRCESMVVEQTPIDPLGHNESEWIMASEGNCAVDGLMVKTCLRCGNVLESLTVPATGEHHYSITESKVSTCATNGYKLYTCSGCGNVIKEELSLDPDNHEGPTDLVGYQELTCGADGYTGDLVCTACGTMLAEGEVQIATGVHTYNDGIFVITATAEHDGVKRFTCTGCGIYYDVDIVWAPHTHVGGESNATCTIRARCSECGQPYGEYNNSKHTRLVNVGAVSATCTEAGHGAGVYCEDCCKYVGALDIYPATGHVDNDSNRLCDVCGAEVPLTVTEETFRCSMCDVYEDNKDKPAIGVLYKIIHSIIHFFESLFIYK